MLGAYGVLFIAVALCLHYVLGQAETLNSSASFTYTSYLPYVITCNASQKPLKPSSLTDLQQAVDAALRRNITLKPLGNRHSLTDIICTDGVPISMQRINHFRFDQISGIATVGAGATIHDFFERLYENGRTVSSGVLAFSGVTVGGAIGSGASGSAGRSGTRVLSDLVDGLVVVDGLGNVRNISDTSLLRAFKPNLGLLGIVYELRFRTVPQFKMEIRHFPVADDILFNSDKLTEYLRTSDRFQMWWFPTARQVVMSVGVKTPLNTSGLCETHFIPEAPESAVIGLNTAVEAMQEEKDHLGLFALQTITNLALYQKVPGRTPIFHDPGQLKVMCSTQPPVGYYHKMVANMCEMCPWHYGNNSVNVMEFGMAVPLEQFPAALKTINEIVTEYPVEFPFNPLFFRYLPMSDGLMMMNGGRDSMTVEWVLSPRKDKNRIGMMGLAASQAISQALIEKHNGKPHWGKNGLYYTSSSAIRKAYQDLPEFLRVMREFDPRGVFLNDFGRLLSGSEATSRDGMVQHCALNDDCICSRDEDCGDPNREEALICGELKGFRVCRENPRDYSYKSFRSEVVREVIEKMMEFMNTK